MSWTREEYQAHLKKEMAQPKAANKYHAQKVTLDGYLFDSKKEAARYQELKHLERAGKATLLAVHEVYPLRVNGIVVCEYELDFRWLDKSTGKEVHEDVKSPATRTAVYRLKAKLMKAVYDIEIRES